MIHLYRHAQGKNKGKYDIALVVRGKYILGSNQGYNRKMGAYNAMGLLCTRLPSAGGLGSCKFQDDTLSEPAIFTYVTFDKKIHRTILKPSKPYQPQTIKK